MDLDQWSVIVVLITVIRQKTVLKTGWHCSSLSHVARTVNVWFWLFVLELKLAQKSNKSSVWLFALLILHQICKTILTSSHSVGNLILFYNPNPNPNRVNIRAEQPRRLTTTWVCCWSNHEVTVNNINSECDTNMVDTISRHCENRSVMNRATDLIWCESLFSSSVCFLFWWTDKETTSLSSDVEKVNLSLTRAPLYQNTHCVSL